MSVTCPSAQLNNSTDVFRQTAATLDQDGFPSITFTINLKNEKKGVDEKDVSKYIRRNNLSILTIRSDGIWIDYRRAL